jgi:hypothetical protein
MVWRVMVVGDVDVDDSTTRLHILMMPLLLELGETVGNIQRTLFGTRY